MAELIVALDFDKAEDAYCLAEKIKGEVSWVKIGLELFLAEGPSIVKKFKTMGFNVFLDLKLYDIPNTIKGAVNSAIKTGADMLTIHLSGGKRMCEAALETCSMNNATIQIFGVSVLTSFDEGEFIGYQGKLSELVDSLAKNALDWGVNGIVCSGLEVEKIKNLAPGLKCLTPGIRFDEKNNDDQKRVMTPYQAVMAGSDYLVVGRPITKAEDPQAVAKKINDEIKKAMIAKNK